MYRRGFCVLMNARSLWGYCRKDFVVLVQGLSYLYTEGKCFQFLASRWRYSIAINIPVVSTYCFLSVLLRRKLYDWSRVRLPLHGPRYPHTISL